jgi:hypothetical protein
VAPPVHRHSLASGSMDAVQLCQNHGPVYEKPPAGMRNVAGPGPQVAGPLPAGYEGVLDEDELRGLEKLNGRSIPPKLRRALNAHRP